KFGGRKWPGEVLRLAMLMTHYREPIDFSLARLLEAENLRTGWLGPQLLRGIPERGSVDHNVVSALQDDLDFNAARLQIDRLASEARAGVGTDQGRELQDKLAATLLWLSVANGADFDVARADNDHMRASVM